MQDNSFSTTKNLSKIVVGLLFAAIGIYAVNIIINSAQLIFFPNMGMSEELSTAEVMLSLTAVGFVALNLIVYISIVVTFLIWLHRSYKNLYAFKQTPLASPGWAVGYWFIPFVNLFKPLGIVNEVWHSSDPELLDTEFSYSDTSSPTLHISWWLIWLASNVLSNISTRIVFGAESVDAQNFGTLLVVIALVCSIIAALMLIKIVKNITNRQDETGSKIVLQTPPMPPVFNQNNYA